MGHPVYLKPKECKKCKKLFQPADSFKKYCSYECFRLDGKSRRKGKMMICKICGKEFYSQPCHIGHSKYCSNECRNKGQQNHMIIKCKVCGKEVKKYYSQKRLRGASYCSTDCQWQGQRTKTSKKRSLDHLWAEAVKLRALKRCEYCNTNEKQLHAHHLFSRVNFGTRWLLENGMCLCAGHHRFGKFSAHTSPLEFSEWTMEKIGKEKYEFLKLKSHEIVKPDYIAIKAYLMAELDKLNAEKLWL